jgi:hypothetical protein
MKGFLLYPIEVWQSEQRAVVQTDAAAVLESPLREWARRQVVRTLSAPPCDLLPVDPLPELVTEPAPVESDEALSIPTARTAWQPNTLAGAGHSAGWWCRNAAGLLSAAADRWLGNTVMFSSAAAPASVARGGLSAAPCVSAGSVAGRRWACLYKGSWCSRHVVACKHCAADRAALEAPVRPHRHRIPFHVYYPTWRGLCSEGPRLAGASDSPSRSALLLTDSELVSTLDAHFARPPLGTSPAPVLVCEMMPLLCRAEADATACASTCGCGSSWCAGVCYVEVSRGFVVGPEWQPVLRDGHALAEAALYNTEP